MKVLIFGATGMVGQGVLRECLLDSRVTSVLTIVRSSSGQQHQKVREVIHSDFLDFTSLEPQFRGLDACFFCLGVSAAGMPSDRYRQITYDVTLAAAHSLARTNPDMTFIYVSGMGTDSTGKTRASWSRIKGETENAILKLPFKAAYMFRPALIVPLHGIKSKTPLYRSFYAVTGPVLPWFHKLLPKYVTTTQQVGRAMIQVARVGAPSRVLENSQINDITIS